MSHPLWWHQITLSEAPCPHCEALRWLWLYETDPANRYGFTEDQKVRINAALLELDDPESGGGTVAHLSDGETLKLHKCGTVLVIPEFWDEVLRNRKTEWDANPANRATEHFGVVD